MNVRWQWFDYSIDLYVKLVHHCNWSYYCYFIFVVVNLPSLLFPFFPPLPYYVPPPYAKNRARPPEPASHVFRFFKSFENQTPQTTGRHQAMAMLGSQNRKSYYNFLRSSTERRCNSFFSQHLRLEPINSNYNIQSKHRIVDYSWADSNEENSWNQYGRLGTKINR